MSIEELRQKLVTNNQKIRQGATASRLAEEEREQHRERLHLEEQALQQGREKSRSQIHQALAAWDRQIGFRKYIDEFTRYVAPSARIVDLITEEIGWRIIFHSRRAPLITYRDVYSGDGQNMSYGTERVLHGSSLLEDFGQISIGSTSYYDDNTRPVNGIVRCEFQGYVPNEYQSTNLLGRKNIKGFSRVESFDKWFWSSEPIELTSPNQSRFISAFQDGLVALQTKYSELV